MCEKLSSSVRVSSRYRSLYICDVFASGSKFLDPNTSVVTHNQSAAGNSTSIPLGPQAVVNVAGVGIEKFTFRLRLCSLVFTVQRSLVRDHGLAAIFPYRQSSTEDYSFLPGEQAGVTSNIVYCTVIEKLIACDSVGSRQSENNADNVTTRLIWQDLISFTAVSYAVAL